MAQENETASVQRSLHKKMKATTNEARQALFGNKKKKKHNRRRRGSTPYSARYGRGHGRSRVQYSQSLLGGALEIMAGTYPDGVVEIDVDDYVPGLRELSDTASSADDLVNQGSVSDIGGNEEEFDGMNGFQRQMMRKRIKHSNDWMTPPLVWEGLHGNLKMARQHRGGMVSHGESVEKAANAIAKSTMDGCKEIAKGTKESSKTLADGVKAAAEAFVSCRPGAAIGLAFGLVGTFVAFSIAVGAAELVRGAFEPTHYANQVSFSFSGLANFLMLSVCIPVMVTVLLFYSVLLAASLLIVWVIVARFVDKDPKDIAAAVKEWLFRKPKPKEFEV